MAATELFQNIEAGPAFAARVRLRARRRSLWMRHLWSQGLTAPDQGLAISSGEVDRILMAPAELSDLETEFYASDETARRLGADIAEADGWVAEDFRWRRLRDEFGLSEPELDLFALAVAVELDPPLRRVCAYLHDDASAAYPTPWLAAALFRWPHETAIGPGPLERWLIARPAENAPNPWGPMTSWAADPAIVSWLRTGAIADVKILTAPEAPPVCLYPDALRVMREFAASLAEAPLEIELVARPGSGRRTLAAQFAAAEGKSLVAVKLSELTRPAAIRVARAARLSGAWLYCEADAPVAVLREFAPRLITGRLAPDPQLGYPRRSIALPLLSRRDRLALWSELVEEEAPAPIADWPLTPAELATVALAAPAGRDVAAAVCRRALDPQLDDLLTPLPCPYTWHDFVLPASLRQHLDEFEQQARLRAAVYEDWGFERLVPIGRGLTALFAGPSGAGKTMAAQVLARSLGLDLYRVDLAGVVNKYIGETEKRLKLVFDWCEHSHAMVLFDEADALFGQRMQVKDAHDRFANIEIDYLLQRLERFDGIAVLATNRKSDLDSAFLRRLRFIVDFLQPGPEERLQLWRRALDAKSPSGESLIDEIDWRFLSEKLPMTGADIKMAALSAAFLARGEGSRIGMRHVLAAVRRELAKRGVVLRSGI